MHAKRALTARCRCAHPHQVREVLYCHIDTITMLFDIYSALGGEESPGLTQGLHPPHCICAYFSHPAAVCALTLTVCVCVWYLYRRLGA